MQTGLEGLPSIDRIDEAAFGYSEPMVKIDGTIESVDSNGFLTGNPPGSHDKAPQPPGDFPGFIPKF